jgi:hypothetical protein
MQRDFSSRFVQHKPGNCGKVDRISAGQECAHLDMELLNYKTSNPEDIRSYEEQMPRESSRNSELYVTDNINIRAPHKDYNLSANLSLKEKIKDNSIL